MPEKLGNRSSRVVDKVTKRKIIKSSGSDGVGIVIYARASKPADTKADNNTNNTSKEPEGRTSDGFVLCNKVDYDGGKKGNGSNGGCHAKVNTEEKYGDSEELEMLDWRCFTKEF